VVNTVGRGDDSVMIKLFGEGFGGYFQAEDIDKKKKTKTKASYKKRIILAGRR